MNFRDQPVLALDVGGANIKAAHSSGAARTTGFALWKAPERLGEILSETCQELGVFSRVLMTTTAELCDCYATKRQGVLHILDAVSAFSADRPLSVWGIDGRFHPASEIRSDPLLAAAANWVALAAVAARLIPDESGLLVDVGSTTTDLIPLHHGVVAAIGRTDSARLASGELVYAGVRRTPVCGLATNLPWRGKATGLCAELFATAGDVFLLLGRIPEDPDDRDTADGRAFTTEGAHDRLARMVGEDREGFTLDDATALAAAAAENLTARLAASAFKAYGPLGRRPGTVVVSGSGEFLARQVARRVVGPGGQVVSLAKLWGEAPSTAACARALLELDPARANGGGRRGVTD